MACDCMMVCDGVCVRVCVCDGVCDGVCVRVCVCDGVCDGVLLCVMVCGVQLLFGPLQWNGSFLASAIATIGCLCFVLNW